MRTKRRWIVLALIGMVALGASRESTSDIIRRLEAEVKLLRAQIHSLKRKLADKKPVASSRPASKPVRPPATITPKGARVFSYKFTVYEHNPKWWTDAQSLQDEMTTRNKLQRLEGTQGVEAWMARHDYFAGKKVQWSLIITEGKYINKDFAAAKYISTNKILERMTRRHSRYKQVVSELAQWKALMKDGGAMLVLGTVRGRGLSVSITVPGLLTKHLRVGQKYKIKGRIDSAEMNRGDCTFTVKTSP